MALIPIPDDFGQGGANIGDGEVRLVDILKNHHDEIALVESGSVDNVARTAAAAAQSTADSKVALVHAGSGISVDNTDPHNPIVSAAGAVQVRIDVSGAPADNIDFTGLTGETDGDYEIEFYIKQIAGTSLVFQPQTDVNNGISSGLYTNGVAAPLAIGGPQLLINTDGPTKAYLGKLIFRSKSGQGPRYYECKSFSADDGNYAFWLQGVWTDVGTPITSLRITTANAAPAFADVGSWFVLRKLGNI